MSPLPRFALVFVLACGLGCALRAQGYHWDLPPGFPMPRVPDSNRMSEAKVRLGRYLFYDQRMSVTGAQSCATCHRQNLAFTDGKPTAVGATGQTHPRSAMSLVNVAFSATLTWQNPELRSMEAQALIPLLSEHPVELGLRGRELAFLRSLRADSTYREIFPKAFPGDADPFSMTNVCKALAAFERTIISARSPYDRYHSGDESAISESAKRGETVFFSDQLAGCFQCHGGFNFSDGSRHNTALSQTETGKFKTPTLRNIALTAPYMHDGSVATLEDVLDHYAAGGRARDNPHKDVRMTGFRLTVQNRLDLIEFLRSLTDTDLIRDPRFSDPWTLP